MIELFSVYHDVTSITLIEVQLERQDFRRNVHGFAFKRGFFLLPERHRVRTDSDIAHRSVCQ